MVGNTLTPAIQRVECIAGVRSRNDPFVVRLVQSLIDQRMVQSTMNPVDTEIRERDEEGILEVIVERERGLAGEIVELGVSLHLGHEERRGQRSHDGHSLQGLFDLEGDLIAQELGMLHSAMVVDEIVGESRAEEVEDEAEDPVYKNRMGQSTLPECQGMNAIYSPHHEKQTEKLATNKLPGPAREQSPFGGRNV